jgi:hypothetical protein
VSCLQGAPPTYFIVAGLVFTVATVPYLRSEYGKEYDYDAPVSVQDGSQQQQQRQQPQREREQLWVVVGRLEGGGVSLGRHVVSMAKIMIMMHR